MMGAAIATVAAYTVMFVGMAWWAQRIFPVPYQWRRVATAAAAGVGLAVAGKLVGGGLAARDRADPRLPARAPAARLLPPGRAEAAARARRPRLSDASARPGRRARRRDRRRTRAPRRPRRQAR